MFLHLEATVVLKKEVSKKDFFFFCIDNPVECSTCIKELKYISYIIRKGNPRVRSIQFECSMSRAIDV